MIKLLYLTIFLNQRQKTTLFLIVYIHYSKKGCEKMNKEFNQDPNKVKKCNCEDKYGPKPFNYQSNKPTPIKKDKSN